LEIEEKQDIINLVGNIHAPGPTERVLIFDTENQCFNVSSIAASIVGVKLKRDHRYKSSSSIAVSKSAFNQRFAAVKPTKKAETSSSSKKLKTTGDIASSSASTTATATATATTEAINSIAVLNSSKDVDSSAHL
jgi:hypothetical protein